MNKNKILKTIDKIFGATALYDLFGDTEIYNSVEMERLM